MAAVAPTAVAAANAAAATTTASSASQTSDLAVGIIVFIAIAAFLLSVIVGLVCFCVRRRKTKHRRAALLATAKANAENARLSQQTMLPPYPSQEDGVYHPEQVNGHLAEMPSSSMQSPVEADGRPKYEILSPPPRASEMYSPPARGEMFTGPPPSSELDGSYTSLPLRPDSDVTSPMLRKDHEQMYPGSWRGSRDGS